MIIKRDLLKKDDKTQNPGTLFWENKINFFYHDFDLGIALKLEIDINRIFCPRVGSSL